MRDIYDVAYVGCWQSLYGGRDDSETAGVTYDAANVFYAPFDQRKMRLDRIIMPNTCVTYKPTEMRVCGKDKTSDESGSTYSNVPFLPSFVAGTLQHSDHYPLIMRLSPTNKHLES